MANLTIKGLKDCLDALDLPDDFQIRMCVNAEACSYITEVSADNDTGVLILHTDSRGSNTISPQGREI